MKRSQVLMNMTKILKWVPSWNSKWPASLWIAAAFAFCISFIHLSLLDLLGSVASFLVGGCYPVMGPYSHWVSVFAMASTVLWCLWKLNADNQQLLVLVHTCTNEMVLFCNLHHLTSVIEGPSRKYWPSVWVGPKERAFLEFVYFVCGTFLY